MTFDEDLDVRGLLCPLPVLKLRKRLLTMERGRILRLRADDPAAAIDVPHFCREAGHVILQQDDSEGTLIFHVRREV